MPATTSQVTIGVSTNNPVQITTGVSLNGGTVGTGGSLTVGAGVGSTESLNIGTGGSLTMGNHTITLSGGSITGGSVISTGTIQGFGTFSAVDASSATWSATGTAGNPLILDGGNTYGATFNSSSAGGLDLGNGAGNGVTVSGSFGGSSGTFNLNNATINGAALNNTGGEFYVLGNSTLTGTINFNQYNTFNIGGASGANTLNLGSATSSTTTTLNTVTGGAAPFIIGNGGVLNDYNHAATMGGGGTVNMQGGSITNTSGTSGTTAGLFTVGDPISGYGAVSGNVAITAGNLTAGVTGSAHTLTLNGGTGAGIVLGTSSSGPGMGTAGGGTLDLQGNISVASGANMNPGTGTILLDGMTLSNHNISNSGLTTSGTFEVVNASTLNNNAFSTGTGANLQVNALLNLTNGASLNVPATATINTGGTVNDYSGPIAATVGTLNLNGGSLTNTGGTGQFKVTVSTDYTNANFGTGNSFNPTGNVTGNTVINAGGKGATGTGAWQTITGTDVSNGATAAPTLAFGNVHVGATDFFAIQNTGQNDITAGTNDPSLRGAVQTTGLTGGEVSLAGGDQNFGPIASLHSTPNYTLTVLNAGSLSGQSVGVVSNFANIPTQTIGLTGTAWNLASGSLSPGSQNIGAFHVADPSQGLAGSNATGSVTVTNTAPAAFSESLDVTGTTVTGNFATPTPYPTLIAPGGGTGTISVQTSGGVAGQNNGTVQASLQSDGLGTSGLGTTPLAPSNTVDVTAYGYAYAAATVSPTSVDLGAFRVGSSPAGGSFNVTNSGPATGYTEALDVGVGGLFGLTLANQRYRAGRFRHGRRLADRRPRRGQQRLGRARTDQQRNGDRRRTRHDRARLPIGVG